MTTYHHSARKKRSGLSLLPHGSYQYLICLFDINSTVHLGVDICGKVELGRARTGSDCREWDGSEAGCLDASMLMGSLVEAEGDAAVMLNMGYAS
jgi:hypothetical protein